MEDTVTYQYDYRRVFTKHVSQIDLSAGNNGLSTFSVEFSFETFDYISYDANSVQTSSLPDEIKVATTVNDNSPITYSP